MKYFFSKYYKINFFSMKAEGKNRYSVCLLKSGSLCQILYIYVYYVLKEISLYHITITKADPDNLSGREQGGGCSKSRFFCEWGGKQPRPIYKYKYLKLTTPAKISPSRLAHAQEFLF